MLDYEKCSAPAAPKRYVRMARCIVMLGTRRHAGAAILVMIAAADAAVAQGPRPGGGVNYDFTIANGPSSSIRLQGTMTGMPGAAIIRQCMQPSGSPIQLCQISINGQPGPVFASPAISPPLGSPGASPAPFGPPGPPRWPLIAGMPLGGGPAGFGYSQLPQGFQVSGQGRWGPYSGSGSFSYWR